LNEISRKDKSTILSGEAYQTNLPATNKNGKIQGFSDICAKK
jgi:hypothetical protein